MNECEFVRLCRRLNVHFLFFTRVKSCVGDTRSGWTWEVLAENGTSMEVDLGTVGRVERRENFGNICKARSGLMKFEMRGYTCRRLRCKFGLCSVIMTGMLRAIDRGSGEMFCFVLR